MKKVILISSIAIFLTISTCTILYIFLFPLKYKNQIETYSQKYNLPPSLIASIVNVESGYNKNATSKANAKGLMQLLDSTADEIALKLNYTNYDIFNIETNIEFGCYYLSYLLTLYDNDLKLALCAYNAGLTNVNSWIKNDDYYNSKTLVKIPFKETENYIKKIKINNIVL
jgi:soluble lytic murein transglycosylase